MRHQPAGRAKSVSSPGDEPASRAERSLRARLAAYALHAQHDPRETTANGRAAFLARFDRDVDPEGLLEPDERARRAEQARRAYFTPVWPWPPPRPAVPSVRPEGRGPKAEKRHDRGRLLA
jgi:hypothetical protein